MDKNFALGALAVAFLALLAYVFLLRDDDAPAEPVQPSEPAEQVAQSAPTVAQSGQAAASEPAPKVAARSVGCEVSLYGYDALATRCRFEPLGGGSFRLTGNDGGAIAFPNVAFASDDPQSVTVTVTSTGVASGQARFAREEDSLGALTRSQDDDACWEGGNADGPHRICAR